MTPREIAQALIADKGLTASRKQFVGLMAAIHAAPRKQDGVNLASEGALARRRLKST
jgi:hypothetical protein